MTTRFTSLSAALLALGLALVACSPKSKPPAAVEQAAMLSPLPSPQPPTPSPEPSPTAAPTVTPTPAIVLPDLGPAPDITNEVWLNTEQPLSLEALRGEVVLVEFWTFG